jgi:hypothetical protein
VVKRVVAHLLPQQNRPLTTNIFKDRHATCNEVKSKTNPMKKFILPFLLLAISILAFSMKAVKKKKPVTFSVEGIITEASDYCGGAEPSPEQQFPKPYPKAGIKLLVRKGNFNNPKEKIIDSFVSDAEGKFKVSLPAGTYTFIEPWKRGKYKTPQDHPGLTYDTTCYRKRYYQPDYTLEVKNKVTGIKIHFQRHCAWTTPCVLYNGPMPPSTDPGRGRVGE